MADAPINELFNNTLKDTIDGWKQDGLSDEDIIAKIKNIDFNDIMMSITDSVAADLADFFREKMYEMELEERTKTQEFLAHQEQLWGKCFAASQTMYTITIDAAENISQYKIGRAHV